MLRTLCYSCIILGILCFPASVWAQLTANFSSNTTTGCAPIVVQFNDLSTGGPTSWQWNLGNGTTSTLQNPSTTFLTPGSYTVTLTVSNASGSNTKTVVNYINVIPTPTVSFTASDSGMACPPKTIQFTNQSTPGTGGTTTYYWDFGDGFTSSLENPTHTYTTYGNYSVTLQVTNSTGCTKLLTKPNYIQIVPKPNAAFTASNNNSCTAPLVANFTNTSTGAVSYLWNFGDGTTSTQTSPSHTYTTPGSYTVTLIASNAGGCSDTLIAPATVNIGNLTASFNMSASTSCTNNQVSFTNTTTPGAGNSTWYFGDGGSFTGANATHSYTSAGTYTVTLVVNYNNCTDSATQTITINPGPAAQFTASPTMGCAAPFTTQFTNSSTGASSYLWLFGDGGTSTAASPSHTYTALGNYNVSLVAYAANGCTDTLTMPAYIKVVQPVMTVTATGSSCAPASVTFNTSVSPVFPVTSYSWNFGDGTITAGGASMTHVYSTPGTYTVTVSFSTGAGCNFVSQPYTVNVGAQPTAGFTASPNPVCPGQVITFVNTSTSPGGTTYSWNFGDGSPNSTATNPTHVYNAGGTYTVTLTVNNNGCIATFSAPITVHPPVAQFATIYSCTNKLQVAFNNTSTGGNLWAWDFGDGTTSTLQNPPPHVYPGYGNYNVTLVVTNLPSGCTSTLIVPVFLFDVTPQFYVNDSVICKNETVTFTAVPDPLIAQYSWNFGDGNSQITTTPSVTHAYTTNGTYTVTLVTKDLRDCLDTITKTNYVSVTGPTASFVGNPLSGCSPLTVNFSDQSTSGGSPITTLSWTFGDGVFTTGVPNPAHVYATGVYTVTHAVSDANGCWDSLTIPNYVTASKPTAAFSTPDTNVCPGQQVTFTNSSSGNVLTYNWQFGDGGTSTAASPVHSYVNTGSYTVSLVVTDASSCSDTLVRTTYVDVNGVGLSFVASDTFATCPPLAVNFTNTSTNAGNYTWTFGNNNTSTNLNPSTIYTLPGVYTVTLKGQNSAGCLDSVTKTITILGPTGTLSYAPLNGCAPLTVQFSSVNTNTTSLVWDMNNGVTQTTTASSTSYTYTTPGIYVPKLILSDGASCVVPIQGADTIRVGLVNADFTFTPANLCNSGAVQFIDTTLFTVTPITSRSWTFGDGGTSTQHNPSHLYSAPGTYNVTLVITSSQGCSDTITKSVTILPSPTVSAGNGVAICQGDTNPVQLQASGAISYLWTPVATLSCTTCPNPQATPTATTTYTVVGTGANGCTDTAQVTVTVNPLPIINTGADPTICAGATVQLAVTGAATYSWSPATGLSCTTCPNPIASPATTTTYVVTGTTAAGCSNTAHVTVNVVNNPAVTASATNPAFCTGDSTQLQASGATTYSWSPATGLSCTTCANPTATPAVTTTYTVTGISGSGCSDTASVTITVNPLPAVSAGADQAICLGSAAQLQATGAATYTWSPATGLSCTTCPNPVVNITSTTTYTVTGTSAAGCVNTDQITVSVNALPTITVSNDDTTCAGVAVPLQVSGAQTYTWSPSTALTCTTCPNPSASPTTTTTYTVIGADANGCTDTAQVDITVNPLPTVDAGPDQGICMLNTAQLQATGAITYTWAPGASLSCTACPNPVATPTATTTYTVTGTDANGCTNTDNVVVSINPQPVIDAGPDQTICSGKAVQLTASGGQTYVWSPSAGLSCTGCTSPMASPTSNITYTVVGTDINGCQDSDKVNITVIEMQPFTVGPGDTLCAGESTQLYAAGGDNYMWIPSTGLDNPTISNPTATPAVTTTYTVIIRQGFCFADTSKVTVAVNPVPTVNAGADQTIIAGASVNLYAEATHTTQYLWTPGDDLSCADCNSPIATPKKTTSFTVHASNAFGCTAKDDVTIFVRCDNSQVFVPNTFTPNADGQNDRFFPRGKGVDRVQRFRVYNRWGELVYDVQNISLNSEISGWDGTYKGERLKPDVFVYILEAVCASGEPMQMKGDVSLIR